MKLLVIDGKSIFYRAYYSFNLSSRDTPTGAVYGFFRIVFDIIKKIEADRIVIAWDKSKTNIRRRQEIYPEYKAGRKKPDPDFYEQIPVLMELLRALGWQVLEYDDYEADDIMAALAKQYASPEVEVDLVSSDMDLLQAIGPNVEVWLPKSGAKVIEEFNEKIFEEKYGIRADEFLDLKALKGDSSDNLPGVPGVGEKGAVKLLDQFDTLDGIYENIDKVQPEKLREKLINGRESAYLTKKVATLVCDAPIQDFDMKKSAIWDFDLDKASQVFMKYELRSLIPKLKPGSLATNTIKGSRDASKTAVSAKTKRAETQGSLFGDDSDKVDYFITKDGGKDILVAVDLKQLYKDQPDFIKYSQENLVYDLRQADFLLGNKRKIEPANEENLRAIFAEQRRAFAGVPKLWQVAHELDFPLAYVLYKMEKTGMKIDSGYFAKLNSELRGQMMELEKDIFAMAGSEFNLNSPMQLSQVLFEKLLLPTKGIKKKARFLGTGESELLKLKDQHPIIEKILKYREVSKLVGTYTEALPKLADAEGRIHTTFLQDVTSTGRLSSSEPNLQNIPTRTELGKRVRQGFVAAPGYKLISADYSQFELRLVAFMAGDDNMMEAFADGIDIHTQTASMIFGVPIEDVTKAQRAAAKTVNFGVLYGMGPRALAMGTGMSFAEATNFISRYFEVRKPVKEYVERLKKEAAKNGFVETLFGRRKDTTGVRSYNAMVRAAETRAAVNMPVQGTEADVMKRAMIEIEKRIDAGEFGDTRQIMQVHDSIILEVPSGEAKKIGAEIDRIMTEIAPEIKVKLEVDVHAGENWAEV